MTEYAGRGDPRRTMELLWGRAPTPTRGPRSDLDTAQVVDAAVALADVEGLDGLSMRNLARRLGCSPMALYTHVPGKGELLDLMLDAIMGELPDAYPADDGWRPPAEAMARDLWALHQRHPWSVRVAGGRVPLGPHLLDAHEARLTIFAGLGLDGVGMGRAVTAVTTFVRGAARDLLDARDAHAATGMTDDEWWHAHSPLLQNLQPEDWAAQHPTIAALQAAAAFDDPAPDVAPDEPYLVAVALDAFAYGLERLLDGIAAQVERAAGA